MKVKLKSNGVSIADLQSKLSAGAVVTTVNPNSKGDDDLFIDIRSFNDLQTIIDVTDCKLIVSRHSIVVDDLCEN